MSPQAFIPALPLTRHTHSTPPSPRRPPRACSNPSSTPPPRRPATWQEELATILDPTVPPSVKQVLTQDLLKRTPEILNSATSCTQVGLEGVTQVWRQIADDIIPDLVSNAPRYAAAAANDFPVRMADVAGDVRSGAGFQNVPRPDAEEIRREVRNVFNRTPEGVETPQFDVLAVKDGYEIRKYPRLIVAEANMKAGTTNVAATEVENAAAMGTSFNILAGYLFGKNEAKRAMKMTTPVILSKGLEQDKMGFIIAEHDDVDEAPQTLNDSVMLREDEGAVYAVVEFTGFVTQGEAKRQQEGLVERLRRDGVELAEGADASYKCLIYNGPSTLPNLRRNEIMIQVIYSIDT